MIFQSIGGIRPRRSVFNLSYDKKFTADMGVLYPVMADEMVPGDKFQIGSRCVVRAMPLVAPILHDVRIRAEYFFVPYRILMDDWEEFIFKGVNGDTTITLPTWVPTDADPGAEFPQGIEVGSLWDYFGFPTRTLGIPASTQYAAMNRAASAPIDFPRRAYNMIYNEYYRDQNLQGEVAEDNEQLLRRAWKKDYFTSALPFQQRGTAPALPISGITSADWTIAPPISGSADWPASVTLNQSPMEANSGTNVPYDATTHDTLENNVLAGTVPLAGMNANTVDLSTATTFTPSDLRLAFQVQKWQERNARAGVRYTEGLQAHFGVSPRDDRLNRPEFIGSMVQPLIVSEVLQTSESATTPQGTLAGHGISVDSGAIGSYFAPEFGIVIGLLSIVPRADYQQGINRQWLRRTPFDFCFPEFVNLSEQGIMQNEIYTTSTAADDGVFGFQGRYNEMRYKPNQICGLFRTSLNYWHLGRQFAAAPELNAEFIKMDPDKRIFAVDSEPGFLVQYSNLIRAVRPIPMIPEPGYIDHN